MDMARLTTVVDRYIKEHGFTDLDQMDIVHFMNWVQKQAAVLGPNELKIKTGPLLFQFTTFDNWCDTAAAKFKGHRVRGSDVVCVDGKGRICAVGSHFMKARDDGAFPVNVYAVVPEA